MTKKVITAASQYSKCTYTVPSKVDPALLACNDGRAPEAGKHHLATEIRPLNPESQSSLAGNLWRAPPGGWSYERDSRCYMLSWPEPGNLILDLEARVGARRYWRRMDPSMAYCRAELPTLVCVTRERVLVRDLASRLLALEVPVRGDPAETAIKTGQRRALRIIRGDAQREIRAASGVRAESEVLARRGASTGPGALCQSRRGAKP